MSPLELAAVQCLQLTGSLSLSALGGEETLVAARAEIATSRLLPEFAKALLEEWGELKDRDGAECVLLDGLRQNPDDIAFLDTLDAMMASPALDSIDTVQLADLLIERTRQQRSNFNLRRFAVEGLLRLALRQPERAYDLLGVLSRLRDSDDPKFLASMPRLIGASYDNWRDEKLLPILERLARVPECEIESIVELGMARLSAGLEGNNRDTILAGLRAAHECFALATQRSTVRIDAKAFNAATAILIAFAEGEHTPQLDHHLATLEDAIVERRLWEHGTAPRDWLQRRVDAEGAWLRLGHNLKTVSAELQKPSWLNAVPVIIKVLDVYETSRSYAMLAENGIECIVRPRIEAAFLKHEGLRYHLAQYLDTLSDVDAWRDTATNLRARLDEISRTGEPLGKRCGPAITRC